MDPTLSYEERRSLALMREPSLSQAGAGQAVTGDGFYPTEEVREGAAHRLLQEEQRAARQRLLAEDLHIQRVQAAPDRPTFHDPTGRHATSHLASNGPGLHGGGDDPLAHLHGVTGDSGAVGYSGLGSQRDFGRIDPWVDIGENIKPLGGWQPGDGTPPERSDPGPGVGSDVKPLDGWQPGVRRRDEPLRGLGSELGRLAGDDSCPPAVGTCEEPPPELWEDATNAFATVRLPTHYLGLNDPGGPTAQAYFPKSTRPGDPKSLPVAECLAMVFPASRLRGPVRQLRDARSHGKLASMSAINSSSVARNPVGSHFRPA